MGQSMSQGHGTVTVMPTDAKHASTSLCKKLACTNYNPPSIVMSSLLCRDMQ
jgi:hypothetical protein